MAKKAVRWSSMESSPAPGPSSSSYEARARLRHQSLLQDYKDLLKETKAKRKRLLKANQMKLKHLAEVKFLRKKLKSFSRNLSLESYKMAPSSARYAQIHNSDHPSKAHLEDRNYKITEAAVPATATLLDLNQDVVELEEQEPSRVDILKMRSVGGSAITNDHKLSLCRDVGNEANQMGRRKTSLQEYLPLRV